jgi:uncharacterized membrane protein (DUF485 family)
MDKETMNKLIAVLDEMVALKKRQQKNREQLKQKIRHSLYLGSLFVILFIYLSLIPAIIFALSNNYFITGIAIGIIISIDTVIINYLLKRG